MFGLIPYDYRKNHAALRRPRDLFDSFFGDDFFPAISGSFSANFSADIKDLGNEYVIEAELPGVTKDDIKLELHDDVLTVAAEKKEETKEERGSYVRRERRFGAFSRSFRVEDINRDGVNAKFENGILRVILPKSVSAETQGKTIEIN